MIERLDKLCEDHGVLCSHYFKSGNDGYYAAHLYLTQQFEIPRIDFDTELVDIDIELQVTTQLQDVIRRLLHIHYEERRKQPFAPKEQWQWDHGSDEFATNYLGHILHYVEGMIVEVRDRNKDS